MIQNASFSNSFIQNNYLHDSDWYGAYIFDCANLTVQNNICLNTDIGISIFISTNITVVNNTCSHGLCGILFSWSSLSTVNNNECHNNTLYGISISFSDYVNVSKNKLEKSGNALSFYSSDYATVISNYCKESIQGINYFYSTGGFIENNTWVNCDVGAEFSGIDESYIIDNYCYSNYKGLRIDNAHFSYIINNTSNRNILDGVRITKSSSSIFQNNTIKDNGRHGIYINNQNHMFDQPIEVIKNTCKNNSYGLHLEGVDSIFISNNTCADNFYGMYLEDSNFNTISYNVIIRSAEYGVSLDELSTWNKIHHNDFVDNNKKGTESGNSQGYDDGYNNRWYDSTSNEGNYWSNSKKNTEYLIDGSAENSDSYPFADPLAYVPTDDALMSFALFPFSLILIILTKNVKRRRIKR